MFEIYTKTITITTHKGEVTLLLRPLSGRFLPKLYNIMGKFNFKVDEATSNDDKAREFFSKLDESAVLSLHEISLETLKKSYPGEDPIALDEFVSQNLLTLFPAIFEVNLGKAE